MAKYSVAGVQVVNDDGTVDWASIKGAPPWVSGAAAANQILLVRSLERLKESAFGLLQLDAARQFVFDIQLKRPVLSSRPVPGATERNLVYGSV